MNKSEVQRIIERLMVMKYNGLSNPNVTQEWIRALAPLEYKQADAVVTYYIKTTAECPAIFDFVQMYNKNTRSRYEEKQTSFGTKCWVCMDKGYVLYKEVHGGNEYEYVAYCDKCEKGPSQRIDGRTLENRYDRHPYYTPPISKLLDTDVLAAKNRQGGEVKRGDPTKMMQMAITGRMK